MHLKPLRRPLEELDQLEIPEVHHFLCPLMHAVGLLWVKSKHYCKPGRIIVLLQEIGNLLIFLVSFFYSSPLRPF